MAINDKSVIRAAVTPAKNTIALSAAGVAGTTLSWEDPEGKTQPFSEKVSSGEKSGVWTVVAKNSRKLQLAPLSKDYPLITTPIVEDIAPGLTLRLPKGFEE